MKTFMVPGLLALLIFSLVFSPVLAETGPVNLTISSVSEAGGYISADLQITPLVQGNNDGYITLWFNTPGGDCGEANLLSWKHLTLGNDTRTTALKAAVPVDVTPGSYEVTAIYGPGKSIPASCDKGASAKGVLTVSTPGQAGHDMAGSLSADSVNTSGPDYQIDAITGIDTAVRVAPSSDIQPGVTIRNAGSDDLSGKPVEVHAYLGGDELTPVSAIVSPMKAGEVRNESLSYTIPAAIPQQSYPFFLIIDPLGEHGPADPATNLKRTSGKMSVHVEDPGVGCGCK